MPALRRHVQGNGRCRGLTTGNPSDIEEDVMQYVKDVMTPQAEVASPDQTVEDAAVIMKTLDIGVLPVSDEEGLVGILTDRDIVVRVLGDKRDPKAVRVGEAMTPNIVSCFEDDDLDKAAKLFADHQIRRLPVLNSTKELVGILSLGDLAVRGEDERKSSAVLEDVSQPIRPHRSAA
jgi:CBS domain-containing protein